MARAAELYERAEAVLEELEDANAALQLYAEAYRLDPENEVYLSALASLYADEGMQENALHLFQNAVERFPNGMYEKFAYLGQMLDGEDAVKHDARALELLRRDLAQASASGKAYDRSPDEVRKLLSSMLVSMAEKLLSSERPIEEISSPCECYLREARQVDPKNAEPVQVLASLRSEQARPEEALKWLQLSMQGWSRHRELFMPEEEEEETDGKGVLGKPAKLSHRQEVEDPLEADFEDDGSLPSFESRFETAKLLLELDESTTAAAAVCKALVMENEDALDAWYLWALTKFASQDFETALDILSEASEAVEKLVAQQKCDPADATVEAIATLKVKVEAMMAEEECEDGGPQPME